MESRSPSGRCRSTIPTASSPWAPTPRRTSGAPAGAATSTSPQTPWRCSGRNWGKVVGRLLERSFIFRLAVDYGLVEITGRPVEFQFERDGKVRDK